MECLVVGGGIMGLLSARELSLAGWQVKVAEQGTLGREASWAGGGILSPLYPWREPKAIEPLAKESGKLYAALAEQLFRDTGIDPQWRQCGMLWLDLKDLETACAWWQKLGCAFERLDRAEVVKRWPFLAPSQTALWVPSVCQIRNPRLLKALRQDLIRRGVCFAENTQVIGWRSFGSKILAARTSASEIKAEVFIVAAGAWTPALSLYGFWHPHIRPIKGQMLSIKALPDTLDCMVQRGEHYLIPRQDGRILVGSTVEEAGFDKRPTESAYRKLYEFALGTLPKLKYFPVESHWAGLRPAAPSGIPYIGRHPQLENLYYNCGHFRNGVTMAPAAAKLLADLILGRTPQVDPKPYLPENRQ